MTETPTYEDVLNSKRFGGAITVRAFLEMLIPGEPVRLRESGTSATSRQQYVTKVAKDIGIPIATRTIDGVVWVVRLLPDDAMARLREVKA